MTKVQQKIPSDKIDKTQRLERVTPGEMRNKVAERRADVTEREESSGCDALHSVPSAQGKEQAKRIARICSPAASPEQGAKVERKVVICIGALYPWQLTARTRGSHRHTGAVVVTAHHITICRGLFCTSLVWGFGLGPTVSATTRRGVFAVRVVPAAQLREHVPQRLCDVRENGAGGGVLRPASLAQRLPRCRSAP